MRPFVLKKFLIAVILFGIPFSILYSLFSSFTFAFNPPTQGGGLGSGAIGVDTRNNLVVGTSTPLVSDSKVLIYATSSNTFYLKVVSPTSTPIFVVTNNGRVGIATSTPTSTLTVQGDLTVTGIINGIFNGPVNGTVSAANVSADVFGRLCCSVGNYSFPASLGVGISNTTGLSGLQVNSILPNLAVKGIDNVRFGVLSFSNTPQLILEDYDGVSVSTQWEIDNTGGVLKFSQLGQTKFLIDFSSDAAIISTKTSIGGSAPPLNKLDVFGAAVIGSGYAGVNAAPANGLLVQGNVGIGTTAPAYTLDVSGFARFKTSVGDAQVIIDSAAASAETIYFRQNAVTKFQLYALNTDFRLYGATSNHLVTFQNSGNVGIGILGPSNKLHISTTVNADGVSIDGTFNPGLNLRNAGTFKGYLGLATAANGWVTGSAANDIVLRTEDATSGNILFVTQAGLLEAMRIKRDGNVGIGTSNPNGLQVNVGVSETARGVDNVRIGVVSGVGVPRIILEDNATTIQWGIDNGNTPSGNPGAFRVSTSSANFPVFRISPSGGVTIGPTSFVHGDATDRLYVFGDVRVGTASANGCIKRADGGGLIGFCSSDVRLKKNIQQMSSLLGKVTQLTPVQYEWRKDEFPEFGFGSGVNIGLVAQDVEKVLPELVEIDEKGYKAIHLEELPFYMLQAIKEQQVIIEELKAKVYNLEIQLKSPR